MDDVSFVQGNGARICVGVRGQGAPLLFIGGTGWDLRKPATPLTSPLTRLFTVALFDQRGQGRSEKPDGPYAMRDYAYDAIAVADHLGWERFHLVGYSFGGMVAQEVAVRVSERIQKLVLAGTTPGGAGGASFPVETLLPLQPRERALKGLLVADKRFAALLKNCPEKAEQRIQRRIAAQTRFMEEPGARQGLEAQLAARAQHDCYDRLELITAQTLVLSGESDGQAPIEAQQRMCERIKRAQMETVPGPHDFLFENNRAYEVIGAFLSEESPA